MPHNGLEMTGNTRKWESDSEKHSEGKVLGAFSRESIYSYSVHKVICQEEYKNIKRFHWSIQEVWIPIVGYICWNRYCQVDIRASGWEGVYYSVEKSDCENIELPTPGRIHDI